MKFIADFHIHSHFSMATSKNLTPEHLDYWAKIKGIDVVGTGDCIHPGWLDELKEKLEPAGNGLYKLKKEYAKLKAPVNANIPKETFFVLTGEISSIYKKKDKVRKIHNVCVFPDFDAAEKVQTRLMRIGNITSDGRPILGLDARILLDMTLESSPRSFLIPAHIWTPWFSALGSKSGFDSIDECFDDLTQHIFAVETGLSSDPAMNRVCGFLDRFRLVSNSDAHSPEKLGREANLFDTELSFDAIYNALKNDSGFKGTIEFHPQEGKYHYDGHRKCNVCWNPLETLRHNGICAVCGKPVTKGVMYRVAELADRSIDKAVDLKEFHSITPLPDLVSELNRCGVASKAVQKEYHSIIEKLGSEFHVLLNAPIDEIRSLGSELLAEGIRRLRSGEVIITEGYDGEFGRIKVFEEDELGSFSGSSLFVHPEDRHVRKETNSVKFNIEEFKSLAKSSAPEEPSVRDVQHTLAAEQKEAIEHYAGTCMVIAGPGSGKTHVLTQRIIHLIKNRNVSPDNILALTFSNKAAREMRERVSMEIESSQICISTFHAFGLSVLREHHDAVYRPQHFYIIDRDEKQEIFESILDDRKSADAAVKEIEKYKQGIGSASIPSHFDAYEKELQIRGAFDLDDLIYAPVCLFAQDAALLQRYAAQYRWILVDEYQDINAKQYEMIKLLAEGADCADAGEGNLFVIGDPDQAIYGFRGSDVKFIDKLKAGYPRIKVITLGKSYRCPDVVMRIAAQALKKDAIKGKPDNRKIFIQETETDKSEADWIAAQIERMMGGTRSFSRDSGMSDGENEAASFSEFGVLCRSSFMFAQLADAFANHGIAYQIIGDPFYRREPFVSLISRFKRIYYHMINTGSTVLNDVDEIRKLISVGRDISDIFDALMSSTEIDRETRKEVLRYVKQFGNDYERFFTGMSTGQDVDDYDDKAESVSLMTIHAAKGLEFNTVFIPGCEQGIIPFELFGTKIGVELAEEERLFYVGATRTKSVLYLTHAKKRMFKNRVLTLKRSELLDRLDKGLLDFGVRKSKKTKPDDGQMDLF